ncbi:hypothetical protein K280104A7_03220 [Candidatus Bariatricus faecipullorum]
MLCQLQDQGFHRCILRSLQIMGYPVKRQTSTQPELDAGKEPNVESLIYWSNMKMPEEMIKSIYSSTAGSIYNKSSDEQSPQNIVEVRISGQILVFDTCLVEPEQLFFGEDLESQTGPKNEFPGRNGILFFIDSNNGELFSIL